MIQNAIIIVNIFTWNIANLYVYYDVNILPYKRRYFYYVWLNKSNKLVAIRQRIIHRTYIHTYIHTYFCLVSHSSFERMLMVTIWMCFVVFSHFEPILNREQWLECQRDIHRNHHIPQRCYVTRISKQMLSITSSTGLNSMNQAYGTVSLIKQCIRYNRGHLCETTRTIKASERGNFSDKI